MESELHVTGFLGAEEENSLINPQEKEEKSDQKIANVQVHTRFPNTGEGQNQALFFSGICLVLLLVVLKQWKSVD